MSEVMFQNAIDSLYEVAEVSSAGGIPLSVAVDALKLINPALLPEQAETIAQQHDSRGRHVLDPSNFGGAVREVLSTTDTADAVHILRDLVYRMRLTYRRRYLMYDAPPNQCAPVLLQNPSTVALYRELFDVVARGDDYITRHGLRTLSREVLPEFLTDSSNIVKAALGEGDQDLIGFEEFIMVVQPATSRRPLSEMVRIAKHRAALSDEREAAPDAPFPHMEDAVSPLRGQADGRSGVGTQRPLASSSMSITNTLASSPTTNAAPLTSDGGASLSFFPSSTAAVGVRAKQQSSQLTHASSRQEGAGPLSHHANTRFGSSSENTTRSSGAGIWSLHHELQQAKQQHEIAEDRFQSVLSTSQRISHPPLPVTPNTSTALAPIPTEQERELAELRLKNEDLSHQVSRLSDALRQSQSRRSDGLTLSPSAASKLRTTASVSRVYPLDHTSGDAAAGTDSDLGSLYQRISDLENELRNCRAQLAVQHEISQLMVLLRKSNTTQEGLRKYYHDESTLIAKQEYLRGVSHTILDGGASPLSLVVAQYDLIVCGYQALYRELKRKSERQREAETYNSGAAAHSIVPHHTPMRYMTPTRSSSPAKRHVMPMRWHDVDAEVSNDMKHTRTLRDPLLTDEERHVLRAKLATQMRGAARSYTPPRLRSTSGGTSSSSSFHAAADGAAGAAAATEAAAINLDGATQLTSHDTVSRLMNIASRAQKQRRL